MDSIFLGNIFIRGITPCLSLNDITGAKGFIRANEALDCGSNDFDKLLIVRIPHGLIANKGNLFWDWDLTDSRTRHRSRFERPSATFQGAWVHEILWGFLSGRVRRHHFQFPLGYEKIGFWVRKLEEPPQKTHPSFSKGPCQSQ